MLHLFVLDYHVDWNHAQHASRPPNVVAKTLYVDEPEVEEAEDDEDEPGHCDEGKQDGVVVVSSFEVGIEKSDGVAECHASVV